jgi:non-homologous end joining protein Ku
MDIEELRSMRNKLAEIIVKMEQKGLDPKKYYDINEDKTIDLIQKLTEIDVSIKTIERANDMHRSITDIFRNIHF